MEGDLVHNLSLLLIMNQVVGDSEKYVIKKYLFRNYIVFEKYNLDIGININNKSFIDFYIEIYINTKF